MEAGTYKFIVTLKFNQARADTFIASLDEELSRTRSQELIESGLVLADGHPISKPSKKLSTGMEITLTIPVPEPTELIPENIPLEIVFEDEHMLAVNKPHNMVVHPAPGHPTGTLVNAVLYHCGDLTGIGDELRPGIVHRLDMDTSGVMLVAKTQLAHLKLSEQFQDRTINKLYIAYCMAVPFKKTGTIETLLGRHPIDRKKFCSHASQGKIAITRYKVTKNYAALASKLEVRILTGRTHQIRVHMAEMGHPVLGESLYAKNRIFSSIKNEAVKTHIKKIKRHALHARAITFLHPASRKIMSLEAPLPKELLDLEKLLESMKHEQQ